MMLGHVRDDMPYLTLALPGVNGPLAVEFIVGTGFAGELALPRSLAEQLDGANPSSRPVRLADGAISLRPYFEITLEWADEERLVEVLLLEGEPLLGGMLLRGFQLRAEMTDGGEVEIEPL